MAVILGRNHATDSIFILMKRIIIIDGCAANILFPKSGSGLPLPTTAVEGGRLVKAAATLGETGRTAIMMGEAGRDRLGDLIVRRLEDAGVDVSCIDRYSDGASTPSVLIFPAEAGAEASASIVYRTEMDERWDSKWPRVDAGDIVLFGGFFALQARVRPRLVDFLTYARERGVLTVNLPGFNPALAPAVTRIMPALLEDFEMADAVFTATSDIAHLFPGMTPEECYAEKISFYSRLMVNVDTEQRQLTVMYKDQRVSRRLPEYPGMTPPLHPALPLALFADALAQTGVTPASMESLTAPVIETIADITSRNKMP